MQTKESIIQQRLATLEGRFPGGSSTIDEAEQAILSGLNRLRNAENVSTAKKRRIFEKIKEIASLSLEAL